MYKTKGLEMLMFDGVHPDNDGQHSAWERTWVAISDVVGHEHYDYRGLGYVYFVNFVDCTFHCFDDLETAMKYFNENTCVWVDVSCHQCYRVDEGGASW